MRRQSMLLILLLISVLFFTSCEEPTSGDRFPDDYYYIVTGKLYQGEPITMDRPISVGRTIPYQSGSLYDTVIDDAQVKIIYEDQYGEFEEWELEFGMIVPDSTRDGGDVFKAGYYDPTGVFLPRKNKSYRLEIFIPGNDDRDSTFIWSETRVPDEVEYIVDEAFSFDTEEIPNLRYETANTSHPLIIKKRSSAECNLFYSFYCLEEYYNARRIHTFLDQGEYPEEKRDYEDPMTGEPRKIEYFYTYQPEPLDGMPHGYYVKENGYKIALWFYGKYRVQIYNMDDNFFNYKKAETDPYMYGGVNNAYGYFGSVSGVTLYTNVTE